MVAMSKKLYKNSPKFERDEESGAMGVKKPSAAEKESAEVNSGTDGIMTTERQMKEISDTHARHQAELKDLHKRHQKEMKSDESKETEGSGDGEEKIEKVSKEKE